MIVEFAGGQLGSLSVSCASYLGSGHRIEFYGEDGALALYNPGPDYMGGFNLLHAAISISAYLRSAINRGAFTVRRASQSLQQR
jgi:predicted dehydrogenase